MPTVVRKPIGRGRIIWLGVNQERGKFSTPRNTLTIHNDGIEDDMYRGWERKISGHDVDYVATDGVVKGDPVLNLRQITIVEESEVAQASASAGVSIEHGMLRENMVVRLMSETGNHRQFSSLRPLSRMVIGHGDPAPKVLLLTEENGPCRTICQPLAAHFNGGPELAESLDKHLGDRRGQMAMVRSGNTKDVHIGDIFKIFPPMT